MKNTIKKAFGKLFLKKLNTHPESAGKYEIRIINEQSDSFYEQLGMSRERAEELGRAVGDAVRDQNNKNEIQVGMTVSRLCTHPNELYFISTITRSTCEAKNNPMSALMQMLTNR